MASSGKITAHNLHLLQDDDDEMAQDPTNNNGVDDKAGIALMPDDDLALRTGTADSRSSADSRKLDESPVDDGPGELAANLVQEAKYQEELRERVKRSFADLGIEPEGVLLKDSLEETPRDSLEINEDLPYGSVEQGKYDARRKKQVESVPEDELSEGSVDEAEVVSDKQGGGGDETPVNHADNVLADSLEDDGRSGTHVDENEGDNGAESPRDKSEPLQSSSSPYEPFKINEGEDPNPEPDDDNIVRDSLESYPDQELHGLNDSHPSRFEGNETEYEDDGDAPDAFPTPEKHTGTNEEEPAAAEEEEEYPHLSQPLALEDGADERTINDKDVGDDNDDDPTNGLISDNVPHNDRTDDDDDDDDVKDQAEEQSQHEPSFVDDNQEPYDGEGSVYESNEPEEDFVNPNQDDYKSDPHLATATLDKPLSRGSEKSFVDSERQASRSSSRPPSHRQVNVNNNTNGSTSKPPSGRSARSRQSSANGRSSNPSDIPSPAPPTPTLRRDSSQTRILSSRTRSRSRERGSSEASRHKSSDRVGSAGSQSHSASAGAKRADQPGPEGPKSATRRGSADGQRSRRGSNEINIPRYAPKGMSNSNMDKTGVDNGDDLQRDNNAGLDTSKGNSRSDHLPQTAAVADDPAPRLQFNGLTQKEISPVQPETGNGNKPSHRDFMTPGQKQEAEASQQFWSDMHQAGVFNQPIKVVSSSKPAKKVEKLDSGEKVRVEYISDDSGDEDLHFVDEKGSPIDQLGRPLYAAPETPSETELRIMYRIKPSPPKQRTGRKSSSGRQISRDTSAADSSRYSSGVSTRNVRSNLSGKQSSRNRQRQVVDRQVSPIENEVLQENTQQQGVLEDTVPPSPVRERPVKSACLQTDTNDEPAPGIQEQKSIKSIKSPVHEASMQTIERETSIQTSDGYITGENDNTLPPHQNQHVQSPRDMRGGPYGQGQVNPYYGGNPGAHLPSPGSYQQPNQFQFPADAYAQQIPMGHHPNNPQAHWQPAMGHPGSQGQPFAAPLQPQFVNPMMNSPMNPAMNQPMPQQFVQPYPGPPFQQQMQPGMHPGPYHQPMHPSHGMEYPYHPNSSGSYPNQGRPIARQELEQPSPDDIEDHPGIDERKLAIGAKKPPPKPRQNFIDLNKTSAKLRRDPPNKRYTEGLNQKKGFKSPLNPRDPLPQISRENSQDDGHEHSTGWTPHGSATSRSNNLWAQQVLHEQQMVLLARGISDPNIYPSNQMPPAPVRHGSVPGNYAGYGNGFPTPDTNAPVPNGQPYSWSADRANAYARMNGMQQGPAGGQTYPNPRGSFEQDLISPRQRMAYTHPQPKRTSPFQVLPDISGRRSGEDSELRTSDPDGYFVKHQRQRQGPQYKPYTLKDFQNLKKDFKLGGLGPDKETMSIRQDKAARQREYAKQVMEQNRKIFRQSPNPPPGQGKDSPKTEPTKRDLALEYAKNIPRPRLPTPPEVLHDRLYGSGANSRQSGGSSSRQSKDSNSGDRAVAQHEEDSALEMARLQELTQRHKQEKDELERLRKGGAT